MPKAIVPAITYVNKYTYVLSKEEMEKMDTKVRSDFKQVTGLPSLLMNFWHF